MIGGTAAAAGHKHSTCEYTDSCVQPGSHVHDSPPPVVRYGHARWQILTFCVGGLSNWRCVADSAMRPSPDPNIRAQIPACAGPTLPDLEVCS
ncbi:hypothetical protein GCM10023205_27190 [Yinghuangia aomiensis]|uniref:Uncharacterized protein n=1 Tax=Yinghuangia aomiensis TaxID=676205 RepID=A0ABP9H4G5_9ACTN